MQLSLIVAMANDRVIGVNNQLPWHLPPDLQHFKSLTMGKPIIMGRSTFESIGKPLPGRKNIVLSRSITQIDGCEVYASLEAALATLSAEPEVMVIGGAQLYASVIGRVDCMYLTLIDKQVEGDSFFPEWNPQDWQTLVKSSHEYDDFCYHYLSLKRR